MAERKIKLAIFISGRGSNMEALIRACKEADYPAEIAVVLSNKPDAKGLETAKSQNIPVILVDHKTFDNKQNFENAIIAALEPYNIDLICLAGFMRLLSSDFIAHYQGRIINIHPSLLPDYKGQETHSLVLRDGKTKTGCTVHYVVAEMDSGPIILQKEVPVEKTDTVETLAARVLTQEHVAYPEAVRTIAKKMLQD